jgi:hypothetical protein
MSFPYQAVFHQLEKSLIEYGAKRLPRETIVTELNVYKTYETREMTDALCFSTLVYVTFYSGSVLQLSRRRSPQSTAGFRTGKQSPTTVTMMWHESCRIRI